MSNTPSHIPSFDIRFIKNTTQETVIELFLIDEPTKVVKITCTYHTPTHSKLRVECRDEDWELMRPCYNFFYSQMAAQGFVPLPN